MVQMIVVTSHQSLVPSHQSLVTVLFYIPHGSDNTAIASMGGKGQIVFISHMVQIIRRNLKLPHINSAKFISHMVQIILRKDR